MADRNLNSLLVAETASALICTSSD